MVEPLLLPEEGTTTVKVVSSRIALDVYTGVPARSRNFAPAGICNRSVPVDVGVTCRVNTAGAICVIAPLVTLALPALEKSTAVIVAGSIGSLNVNV